MMYIKKLHLVIDKAGTRLINLNMGNNTATIDTLDIHSAVKNTFVFNGARYIDVIFPASRNEWEAYVSSFPKGYRPMRRKSDGTWLPNRHQRKHGCLSLEGGGL